MSFRSNKIVDLEWGHEWGHISDAAGLIQPYAGW